MNSDLFFHFIGITSATETLPLINPLQYNDKGAAYIQPALRLNILYLSARCVSFVRLSERAAIILLATINIPIYI